MKQFIAPTEEFIKQERTVLDADVSAGSNVALTLVNNNGMAVNTFIVIGIEGSEKAEITKINASVTPGASVQVNTLIHSHKKGEPVTVYRFDKRKFYGCTTESGSYTELTSYGSPQTIQVDDPQGTLFEYAGVEGYLYFKATYYNSSSLEETSISDSDAIYSDTSLRYTTIYNIREQAGLKNNPYITDGQIETYRKRAENEVKSYITSVYQLPLSEVPAIIENVTTLLAAGYMDYQQFGKDGEGVKWLGEARGVLKAIQTGKQRLLGVDDTELATIPNATSVSSYPDSVDNSNGPIRMFTTKQRF